MALLSRNRRNFLFAAAAAAVVSLGAMRTPAAAQDRSLEYAVKATYLYKFAPFVEWPPRAFASASAPFGICLLGQDPFGALLDRAVAGQTVAGRPIVVRRLRSLREDAGCQVLYLGRSRGEPLGEVLRAVAGSPILTVTDSAEGVEGGIVQFEVRDGRVRFALDAAAADANGLSLSSKLLGLAVRVRRTPG